MGCWCNSAFWSYMVPSSSLLLLLLFSPQSGPASYRWPPLFLSAYMGTFVTNLVSRNFIHKQGSWVGPCCVVCGPGVGTLLQVDPGVIWSLYWSFIACWSRCDMVPVLVLYCMLIQVWYGPCIGKSVLYDQPTHVGRESVDCRPLVDRSLAVSRPSVGR